MTISNLPAKACFHLVNLDRVSIFHQLQIEESLLRGDDRNWCLLNSGASDAIVLGISGVKEKLINPVLMQQKPVPLVRRFSGGGTVYVDKNTVFATWICNTAHIEIPCCPQKIHGWMEGLYQKAFPFLKMKLRENDYVIGERKWGGNAQYLCKKRWLHHTSMLWDYDPEKMHYLLMPSKTPSYRQARSHADFLCKLNPYFSHIHDVKKSLANMLEQQFHVVETTYEEIAEVLKRLHRRATCLEEW